MPDRHGKLTDHFCRSLVLDKSETDLDYCQPIASRRVTEEVSKNARRATLPVLADVASGSAMAYSARVALVWACPDLLPAPDSCRVLRAGGRVKDRAGARPA